MPTQTIQASQFVAAEGLIVESAALLADEVLRRLSTEDVVAVDFRAMRGLSSSYFNILLQRVAAVTTLPHFSRRVHLVFDSPAQEQVFKRSLDFATRTVA